MAKRWNKALAFALALCMCAGSMNVSAWATTTTETVDNEDGTSTEITTTTETTPDSEGNLTVTVTVEKSTDGTTTDGVDVDRDEKRVETTVTDENGEVVQASWEEDGTETKEWTEEDDGSEAGQPEVEVPLEPGKTTTGTATTTETTGNINSENGQTTTTTTDRTVTVQTGGLVVTETIVDTSLKGPQSELKFDRNDSDDQTQQRKDRDLYTDNGHFTDPDSIVVTDAPKDYPFKYIGTGDYSGHYVSHIRVIYERDEDGNPIKDENGNYVIKELQHSNGTPLTQNGEPTTDINGPFEQTTGTRPQQFLLKNEDGDTVYAYCIDVETGADKGTYYSVSNLEDNDYYASDEAEKHIRSIVMNGYWGTSNEPKSDGSFETGSLAKLKDDMKKAVAEGLVEKEYDISFAIREKNTGRELQKGEYIYGSYIYRIVTEHIVLTDEVIDSLTEGEALDATQSAIWSYANGSLAVQDGKDGMIVGDIAYASSAMGDSRNGQNDFAGAARTKALYSYLINLETKEESTVVINEKNFINDFTLTVEDKVVDVEENKDENEDNDVYNAELNFKLEFKPSRDEDDLLVYITYKDYEGNEQTIVKRLAGKDKNGRVFGEAIKPDGNGDYTIEGLKLSENQELTFDLRLEGCQELKNGVYIYTSQGGIDNSQTFVGIAEGINEVDISKSVTINFNVDENNYVKTERKWHDESDPVREPSEDPEYPEYDPDEQDDDKDIPDEDIPLVDIPDEEIPLASVPQTGVNNTPWSLMVAAAGLALAAVLSKKNK